MANLLLKNAYHKHFTRATGGMAVLLLLTACGPPIDDSFFESPYDGYSEQAVNYFLEIGLCPEFSTLPCDPKVTKWDSDVRVQLHGQYSPADEEEVNSIISELSELTGLSVTKVNSNANINIHIVPHSSFTKYCRAYNPDGNQDGYFQVSQPSDKKSPLSSSVICIKNNLEETHRHHLLREELTQSFGIFNDSYSHTGSVFQQDPYYTPTEYAEIDREVIRLLYDKRIKPGMTGEQIKSTLTVAQQTASL